MTRASIILTLLALATLSGTANAATRQPSGPCIAAQPIKPSLGGPVVERRVRHLIACSTNRWPVPGGTSMALCIAHRESGPYLWPWADSGSSKGTFQLNATYFPAWRARYWERRWLPSHLPGWFNPRGNVVIAIRMMHDVGLGPWGGGC